MTKPCAVGIDVGGTYLKGGLVDAEGRIHARVRVATPASGPGLSIISTIVNVGRTLSRQGKDAGYRVEGVGVAMPHYSVGSDWVQTYCSNLPSLEGFALRPPLVNAFGESIACEFDTNAAALAEYRFGAAVGSARALVMVIGTGISCGIVVDGGTLLRYTFGTAGETGHIIVEPEATERCSAGCRGCLESIASASAIRKAGIAAAAAGTSVALAVRSARGDLDSAAVSRAAEAGDPVAIRIIERAGTAVGIALTSLLHIYCPDVIVLGGGVSAAGEALVAPARRVLDATAAPFFLKRLRRLRLSPMGPDAGLVGAASLILVTPHVQRIESGTR